MREGQFGCVLRQGGAPVPRATLPFVLLAPRLGALIDRVGERRVLVFYFAGLTVFFLGYSDSHVGDQDIDLTQSGRTLFAKIGYAWVL